MFAAAKPEEAVFNLAMLALVGYLASRYLRRQRPASTAHGSAFFMTDKLLKAWGMLSGRGIIIGRTLSGKLLTVPSYVHGLIVGGPGTGKSSGLIVPALLTYFRGSVVVFDPTGALYAATARFRAKRGQKIIRLNPFHEDSDRFNPLDLITDDDPLLVDKAQALSASLIVAEPGEREPYWNQRSMQILTGILVYVLRRMVAAERNLTSVLAIASNPAKLAGVGEKLIKLGGSAAIKGGQIQSLFESGTTLTKEGSGAIANLTRHLTCYESEAVARCVSETTFDPRSLTEPGVVIYMQIAPHMLDALKGILRMWVSSFVTLISSTGSEVNSETLFLLDEASALGGLPAVEEALVRGRSAGCRIILAYQSATQVTTGFLNKPSLLYDNCSLQVWLGASSLETADRISKMCGDYTQWIETPNESASSSSSASANGDSRSRSYGTNASLSGRALLQPAEVLAMPSDQFIAFVGGLPGPILGRRIRWFEDPAFVGGAAKRPLRKRLSLAWRIWIVLVIVLIALVVRAKVTQKGYWQPEQKRGARWQTK